MNDKISFLRNKYTDHGQFRGLINKSVNFWKHDLKIPQPCCGRETSDFEENREKLDSTAENLSLKDKKGRTSTTKEVFKTVKTEEIEEKIQEIHRKRLIAKKKKKEEGDYEKLKYNDWTPQEDILLMKLCTSQFHNKWKKIANLIGNKTPRKCAYRIKKLEKHMHNFELMKSKLHICGEQEILNEYKTQLGKLNNGNGVSLKRKKKFRKIRKLRNHFSTEFTLTLNHLQNLKIESKHEKIEIEKNSKLLLTNLGINNSEKLTTDYDMKNYISNNNSIDSNKSMERSRSSSADEFKNKEKDKNNFEKAFLKVFQFSEIDKFQEIDNKNLLIEEFEDKKIINHEIDNYFSYDARIKNGENSFKFDENEVEEIYSGNDDSEEKTLKLTNYLMELNFRSKETNSIEEKKSLMKIQAKILEYMIALTKSRDC